MPTLAYASVATAPPRYGRLALGAGLLVAAFLIASVSLTACNWLAPTRLSSSLLNTRYYWCRLAFDALTNALILAAVPFLATFRRTWSPFWLVTFTCLAVLHLFAHAAVNPVVFYKSVSKFAYPFTMCLECLDPLLCAALLSGACIVVARLRITPLTILAILCLVPHLLWQVYALVFYALLLIAHVEWRLPRSILVWHLNFGNPLLLLFFLTLTILALVLHAKSRRANYSK